MEAGSHPPLLVHHFAGGQSRARRYSGGRATEEPQRLRHAAVGVLDGTVVQDLRSGLTATRQPGGAAPGTRRPSKSSWLAASGAEPRGPRGETCTVRPPARVHLDRLRSDSREPGSVPSPMSASPGPRASSLSWTEPFGERTVPWGSHAPRRTWPRPGTKSPRRTCSAALSRDRQRSRGPQAGAARTPCFHAR